MYSLQGFEAISSWTRSGKSTTDGGTPVKTQIYPSRTWSGGCHPFAWLEDKGYVWIKDEGVLLVGILLLKAIPTPSDTDEHNSTNSSKPDNRGHLQCKYWIFKYWISWHSEYCGLDIWILDDKFYGLGNSSWLYYGIHTLMLIAPYLAEIYNNYH
jgi:hypothetical protein